MSEIVPPEVKKSQVEIVICQKCDKEIEKDDSVEVDGELVCSDCADESQLCENCDNRFWTDDMHSVCRGDRTVCDDCYDEYSECSSCGSYYHNDDLHGCDSCDSYMCDSCSEDHYHEDERDDRERIYGDTEKGNVKLAKTIKSDRLVGVEIEAVDGDRCDLWSSVDSHVGITGDGSLDYDSVGVELQTPPASADRLEHYIDNASKALQKTGFGVNRSCGLHIHLDSKDIQAVPSKAIKVFNTYYTIEPIIYAMLPKSRRNNSFCRKLSSWIDESEFKTIARATRTKDKYYLHKKYYKNNSVSEIKRDVGQKYPRCASSDLRYNGFNLHALLSLGHLELRYHNGTTNADKIKNWVRFNLMLVDWATKKYDKLNLDILNSIPNDNLDKKLDIFYRLFNVSDDMREYVSSRVKKFEGVGSVEDNENE